MRQGSDVFRTLTVLVVLSQPETTEGCNLEHHHGSGGWSTMQQVDEAVPSVMPVKAVTFADALNVSPLTGGVIWIQVIWGE